jgi:hypothetical protein
MSKTAHHNFQMENSIDCGSETFHPEDSEMAEEFDNAKDTDGLMVYLLSSDLAARVTNAIRAVAAGILSGTIHSGVAAWHHGDERTVAGNPAPAALSTAFRREYLVP